MARMLANKTFRSQVKSCKKTSTADICVCVADGSEQNRQRDNDRSLRAALERVDGLLCSAHRTKLGFRLTLSSEEHNSCVASPKSSSYRTAHPEASPAKSQESGVRASRVPGPNLPAIHLGVQRKSGLIHPRDLCGSQNSEGNPMKKKREFTLFVAGLAFVLISGQAFAQLSATLATDNTAGRTTDRLEIILTGSYTCGPLPAPEVTGFANISGNVSQASGRLIASGFFFVDVSTTCDTAQHTFQVRVPTGNIPWHGGLARVMATLFVIDESVSPALTAFASVDNQVRVH